MKGIMRALKYFTPFEFTLWTCSVVLISVSYAVFDGSDPVRIATSLVGATSLIFTAKGNVIGQVLKSYSARFTASSHITTPTMAK